MSNDDAYGMLVKNALPKPLVGFFAAVMVGAILSSFNSASTASQRSSVSAFIRNSSTGRLMTNRWSP